MSLRSFLAPQSQAKDLYATLLGQKSEEVVEQKTIVLENGSRGAIEGKKLIVFKNALYISAAIYISVDVPFILTHKIPAVIVFLPFVLGFTILIVTFFGFTWPDGFNAMKGSSVDGVWDQSGNYMITIKGDQVIPSFKNKVWAVTDKTREDRTDVHVLRYASCDY